ncbi:MAG: hypothetical protein ACO4AJ_03585 [Prochlorothrix sp.]
MLTIAEIPHIFFYLGAVLVSLLGALVLVWISTALRLFIRGKDMAPALNNFFAAIVNSNYGAAYGMLTPALQAQLSTKDFKDFIKKHNLRLYKRLELPMFEIENNRCPLPLTVELMTGQEVALNLELVKVEEVWQIDGLAIGSPSDQATDTPKKP